MARDEEPIPYPVSLETHISLESREAVLALKTHHNNNDRIIQSTHCFHSNTKGFLWLGRCSCFTCIFVCSTVVRFMVSWSASSEPTSPYCLPLAIRGSHVCCCHLLVNKCNNTARMKKMLLRLVTIRQLPSKISDSRK